jgi:uncharacterized protein
VTNSAPNAPAADGTLARVSDLFVYPIKSLGGVRVEDRTVGDLGLATDRRWMLVDDAGVFLTQRALARMALVHAAPRGADVDAGVRVTAPTLEPVDVLPPPPDAPRRRVQVWDDVVEAQTYAPAVDEWFSEAIGKSCALVFMPDDVRRPVDPTYAGPDDRAAFSDAFPLLLVSRESLADLNGRLASRGVEPVTVRRFRPNVVVEGTAGAFAEDAWGAVEVGEVALRVVKPCARCVLTTVDPDTAEPSPRGEPLRTLATFRTRNGKVHFAQNALVARGGTLRVGDLVREG